VRGAACHMLGMADDQKLTPINPPQGPKVPDGAKEAVPGKPREIGGPKGPEPTRYGDWEVGGRCTDF